MDLVRLLRFIRNHPDFAPLFDHVHALCWPILIWEILWLALYMRRTGHRDLLYTVDSWGFIDIEYADDLANPSAYRAPARTFKPLTDASWSSALPACLTAEATHTFILPRSTGACRDQRSHCDRPGKESTNLLIPNTS